MNRLLIYGLIFLFAYLLLTAPTDRPVGPVVADSCEVQARQVVYPDWANLSAVGRLDASIQIIKYCEGK